MCAPVAEIRSTDSLRTGDEWIHLRWSVGLLSRMIVKNTIYTSESLVKQSF